MAEVFTKNFHIVEKAKPHSCKSFVLAKWEPETEHRIIGVQFGLLCILGIDWELYINVSRTPNLKPQKFFVGLKKEYLFYAQRDAYHKPSGINDILVTEFLPCGSFFVVSKDNPV